MIGCVIFKQYQFEKNNLIFLEVLHVFMVQYITLHSSIEIVLVMVCYIFSCRTLFGVIGLFDQIVLSLQKKIAKKMI